MVAIHTLVRTLDVAELSGTIVAIVCCSVDAFLADDRRSSTDGKNMARCYPGNAAGTLTERATATIHRDFIASGGERQPALVLSLHTTGPTCSEVTLVAYNTYEAEAPEMTAAQREAALAMALPSVLVWGHAADLGGGHAGAYVLPHAGFGSRGGAGVGSGAGTGGAERK